MTPYRILGITLIFYNGEREKLETVDPPIMDEPIFKVKERILDGFKTLKYPPVNVMLDLKFI